MTQCSSNIRDPTADLIRASLKQHGTVAALCVRVEILEAEVKQCALELREAAKLFQAFLPGVADIYKIAATRSEALTRTKPEQ